MPALDARKVVTANEVRFENYRTDLPTVLAQIQAARARGYSLRDVGLVQGTKSLSAWINRPDGQPVAAITLSTVRRRLNPRREAEVAEVLLAAARDVEAAIQAASG
jgi:DNA-binding IclR family transcriptional regulator